MKYAYLVVPTQGSPATVSPPVEHDVLPTHTFEIAVRYPAGVLQLMFQLNPQVLRLLRP